MSLFKRISTPYLLYESLRNYFSINSSGQLSILYRYCLSILYPIEKTTSNDIDFSTFDAWRIKEKIIAGCKWQKAQLTNVLNYLYPSSVTPIYIDETVIDTVYVPTIDFGYSSANPASDYTSFVPEILEYKFILSGIPTVAPTIGTVYINNSNYFTIKEIHLSPSPPYYLVGIGTGNPLISGNLIKSSGTGDATIQYLSYVEADSTVFVPEINTQNLYIGSVFFHIPSDQMANQLDIENTINQISIGVNYKLLAI